MAAAQAALQAANQQASEGQANKITSEYTRDMKITDVPSANGQIKLNYLRNQCGKILCHFETCNLVLDQIDSGGNNHPGGAGNQNTQ